MMPMLLLFVRSFVAGVRVVSDVCVGLRYVRVDNDVVVGLVDIACRRMMICWSLLKTTTTA